MVQTTRNFELLTKNSFSNHIWQSVVVILEDVLVTETIVLCYTINLKTTIFQCSKNCGSPTRVHVTKLNFAPNIAEPISVKESKPLP